MESYHEYIEAQAGFMAHMPSSDNIFVLHGVITHMINTVLERSCMSEWLILESENLWYTLIKLGIRGKYISLIKRMYSSLKSRVKHFNQFNDDFFVYYESFKVNAYLPSCFLCF